MMVVFRTLLAVIFIGYFAGIQAGEPESEEEKPRKPKRPTATAPT